MTDHPVLIHVPVATGATGVEPLRRLIDEFIVHFTHSVQMDWFAPGIKPTGRRLCVPHVGIVAFRDGLIASEHIYWDQASVLVQMGLLDTTLPVLDQGQCRRLLDPAAEANALIRRCAAP